MYIISYLLRGPYSRVLCECPGDVTHHSLLPEVDAHGGGELAVELAVGVSVEEGGLAHPRVSQRQQFDQIVVVTVDGHCASRYSTFT